MILSRITPTLFIISLCNGDIQEFDSKVGRNFYCLWRKSHQMTSWKLKKNNESLKRSRPCGNCMTWRFIKRNLDLIITDWKLWCKEASSKTFETEILAPETEIMRRTPWSKNQGTKTAFTKNSWRLLAMAGSVAKVTIAVSFTILSVEKRHSRIRLQILLCSRMSEQHRELEVPEEEVPVVECFDGLARITSKELAITHFVKSGNFQNVCSTWPKGPKRMMTKVQLLCWRKGDWHESVWKPVIKCCHDGSGRPGKKTWSQVVNRNLLDGNWVVHFQDMKDIFCPGEPHESSPNAPKFEDRSQEETEWQEQGAREAAWKLTKSVIKIKGAWKSNILLTFGACIKYWILGTRICCRRAGASMHMISKKDLSDAVMDNFDEIVQSYDSLGRDLLRPSPT